MADARVVVDVSDLAPGGLRAIEEQGRQILVCNAGGQFFAIENRCPHVAIPLDGGRLEGTILECPLHGGKLDVSDGSPCGMPIRRAAETFPVRPVDGGIEISFAPRETTGGSPDA